MRTCSFTFLALCLLGAGGVLAIPPPPEVVARFSETRALWNTVYGNHVLPGQYTLAHLKGFSHGDWQNYLIQNGKDIVADVWKNAPREERLRISSKVLKMERYVSIPNSEPTVDVNAAVTKRISAKLIEGYAKHLKDVEEANAQAAASSSAPGLEKVVYRHMKMGNENVLLPNPHGRQNVWQ
ncbi:hypothetical protein EX895_005192 [Sporisorium graminicola]|uniref:Uncharacterized protein n=1 Tax=Sporisorium graminicola TaxID=280036 RepID=A0A4U7KRP3_9BASI|nr:hypothetical protein EX895_005192 [Sporisorium graminicola]TKY85652.1 hypothetical protein EX895_005192 [Sporisorium graminicola]